MRLLWLTENYPPSQGGMSQSCDRIVSSLRANGATVDVLHFSNKSKPFVTQQQIGGHYYAVPRQSDVSHSLNVALNFIEHHLPLGQYHGLVSFGGHTPILAGPIYAKLLKVPLYVCFRGNDFDIALFDPKRRIALSDAINNAKALLVNSRQKQQRIELLYPNTKVHYSPSGIDTAEWQVLNSEAEFAEQWRASNIKGGQCVIGLLGFMKRKKGVLFFLNALKQSQAKFDISQAHVMLSGEQHETVIDYLAEQEISHTIIPNVNRYDLLKYYLSCDWLAIPSYYEGMPNAMLEAGALGVPIIASNVDGMRDVLDHNENGLLFRPLDTADCATVINCAVVMPESKRQQLGAALKRKIVQEFSPEREVQVYLNAFELQDAVGGRRSKSPHLKSV